MTQTTETSNNSFLETMFSAGAHFGYSRTRRHPSMKEVIYTAKSHVEIIDLEKTEERLRAAKEFVKELGAQKKTLLFVGTKQEAKNSVRDAAVSLSLPYVTERWVGGLFTNFEEIQKRTARLKELREKKEKGELQIYTKKERLLLSREEDRLEKLFGGIVDMATLPAAMFVVDTKNEKIAVMEAKQKGIPVVALMNSDCNLKDATYPIPANDAARASVRFFVNEIMEAYKGAAN